jgi:hypothetical protein
LPGDFFDNCFIVCSSVGSLDGMTPDFPYDALSIGLLVQILSWSIVFIYLHCIDKKIQQSATANHQNALLFPETAVWQSMLVNRREISQ